MITATIRNVEYPRNHTIDITFPIDEESMMEKLSEINISDSNITDCYVVKISGKLSSLGVLENKCINADEMNYLARRIDSFDNYELAKFQGAIVRDSICTMKDLINLTFNLHNYTVVTDFSNLKNIGSKHYLDKNIGCPVSEMQRIDFETMGLNLLSSGDGKVTPYGVMFCNRLPMEEVYDSKMFPDYDYTSDYLLKLEVTRKGSSSPSAEKVWLYLPTSKACILKALLRLGADTYNDCTFKCVDSMKLPETFMERLSLTDNIGGINELSKIIQEFDSVEIKKLEAVIDYTKAKTAGEMVELTKSLDRFFFIAGISNVEQYGRYMIIESGHFEYDSELERFIDFEKYGKGRFDREQGCFTSYGYVVQTGGRIDQGYDEKKFLNMNSEIQTIKFYSPLFVKTSEPHSYDMCDLSSSDALQYIDEILTAIEKEKLPSEGRKGLMTYFDRDEALAKKVHSANPTVDEYKGELWGVMVTEVSGKLTESEIKTLTDYFAGQYSDGWGEGFEQRGIRTADGEIYVSFWDCHGYYIKPEQEFKQDMEHDLNSGIQKMGGM